MDAIFMRFIFTALEVGPNHNRFGDELDGKNVNLGVPLSSLRDPANYQAITDIFYRALLRLIRDAL